MESYSLVYDGKLSITGVQSHAGRLPVPLPSFALPLCDNNTLIDRKQNGMALYIFDLTFDNHQTAPFL
jgi:hypothetical protein